MMEIMSTDNVPYFRVAEKRGAMDLKNASDGPEERVNKKVNFAEGPEQNDSSDSKLLFREQEQIEAVSAIGGEARFVFLTRVCVQLW